MFKVGDRVRVINPQFVREHGSLNGVVEGEGTAPYGGGPTLLVRVNDQTWAFFASDLVAAHGAQAPAPAPVPIRSSTLTPTKDVSIHPVLLGGGSIVCHTINGGRAGASQAPGGAAPETAAPPVPGHSHKTEQTVGQYARLYDDKVSPPHRGWDPAEAIRAILPEGYAVYITGGAFWPNHIGAPDPYAAHRESLAAKGIESPEKPPEPARYVCALDEDHWLPDAEPEGIVPRGGKR